MEKKLTCGLECSNVTDVKEVLEKARSSGYDFVCIPIVHTRFKREFIDETLKQNRKGPFTRTDLVLNSADWSRSVVGKLSPYIKLDSPNPMVRKISEAAIEQELLWCYYLGLPSIMMNLPTKGSVANLARIIHKKMKCSAPAHPQFIFRVPLLSPEKISAQYRSEAEDADIPESLWARWNELRTLCDTESQLSIALEVTDDLPSDEEIERWRGEPVKFILLKTRTFITNKKGFPVLSKGHQDFVRSMICSTQFIISGTNRHKNIEHYYHYLHFLWQSSPSPSVLTAYGHGYEDFLQIPLQPLMDHLDSDTYEVFEKDPVKYSRYQCAIYKALLNKQKTSDEEIVIMVVGAGRGPLVRASLNAASKAGVKVKVYAVEKNPNAVVALEMQKNEVWNDLVDVVQCDMRIWNAPQKADILVSELLGSFGDNELSPECLDGAQKFLKDDGISIPKNYTSFLCPIQSHKLYSDAKQYRQKDKHPFHSFEQLYVVHQLTVQRLAPIKSLFTFEHPNREEIIDNNRYSSLTFDINMDCVLHGFSGYFESVLYDDVMLSIVPETYSDGMCSWFPIYLPLREPVQLKKDDVVEVHVWRIVSKTNVWYEWAVTKPVSLPIHNPNGRSYHIGLH